MGHPIAIITYHRPEHTRQVLSALRGKFPPEDLYIFRDGPKDNQQDVERCQAVGQIIADTVDWGTPHVVIRHENWGLRRSITHAVDYVLDHHDTVILLEDDCVPGPYFYPFMSECLDRYKNDDNILGVTGYTIPIPDAIRQRHPWDVYFLPRIGSWGWATWRHTWKLYERDVPQALARAQKQHIDLTQGGRDIPGMIQMHITAKWDIWTPGWILAAFLSGRQFIYPMLSHVENIGLDGSGVHCSVTTRMRSPIAQTMPTRFPPSVVDNKVVRRHFRQYFP